MAKNAHWNDPAAIMAAVAAQYQRDRWANQPVRVEVWVEKEALVGVIERVARANDVPYFACRGYVSTSAAWTAAQRIERYLENGAESVVILHLGDHDPSGIDMTRDLEDRLALFLEGDGYEPRDQLKVRRIALNEDQVREYNPPPNPTKLTDSRAAGYIARFGRESWELDALDPPILTALVQDAIDGIRDPDLWEPAAAPERAERELLAAAGKRWSEVAALLPGASPE